MTRLWSFYCCFFCQAEDGIRDLVRSRGLGDVYKRQRMEGAERIPSTGLVARFMDWLSDVWRHITGSTRNCLLYTSDAADERSSVDLGGRRIIKKKTRTLIETCEV
mgnify:CR=1 FL=1